MGVLGLFDMLGGAVVGLLTTGFAYLIKRFKMNEWFIALPIILIPGLVVPIWLSYLFNLPYIALAISLLIGQIIPGILGVLIVKQMSKILLREDV